MLHQFLIPALLFGITATALPAPSLKARQVTSSAECPTTGVHVIAVSGAGNVPIDQYGLLGNLSNSIITAIPGSTTVQVPYDKSNTNQYLATTAGVTNFTQYVNDFHASCPCSKVVIIGYSSGSIISMNSLCGASAPWTTPVEGFGDSYRDFVVGVIVYGDQTRTASASFNLGTCTGSGRYPRTATNAACTVFADRIQSYCDVADPQCCLGTVDNAHFLYDLEYDGASTQFIAQQAASFGDVCSSTVSSSTISSSSTSTTSSDQSPTASASISSTTSTELSSTVSSTSTSLVSTVSSTSTDASSTLSSTSFSISTSAPAQTSTTTSSVLPSSTSAQSSSTTSSVPPSSTSVCPMSLDETWEFPHLIVPVSSTFPGNAYGTSYNGQVNSTTSSIFNFDIPVSYADLTCTLFFSLPELSALTYSSYTISGGPGVSVALLSGIADSATTYNNAPHAETTYGDFVLAPGTSVLMNAGPCAAGQTLSYEMSATGDYALEYFQASGDALGLYIRAC